MTEKTLLIVEDEMAIRKALAIELKIQGGFRCLEASDHPEAIALLKKENIIPSVILADIMMPSSANAGIRLIQELKSHAAWKKIPVIVLSARAEAELILEALRHGAIDYLTKPYDPEELLNRVERAYELLTLMQQPSTDPTDLQVEDTELRWRKLHVEVIQLSLLYWEMTTRKTKLDLAERSNLWSRYLDSKGCYRTKTLDRYLHTRTLPKRPNTQHVLKTAHFVLANCPQDDTFLPQLKSCLEELESLNRSLS